MRNGVINSLAALSELSELCKDNFWLVERICKLELLSKSHRCFDPVTKYVENPTNSGSQCANS